MQIDDYVKNLYKINRGSGPKPKEGSKETEAGTQKAILDYLKKRNIFAWRNNTGAVKVSRANGSSGFIKFGTPGSADIIGIYKGRFLAIEVKGPKGELSDEQIIFLKRIENEGGISIVARSLEDVLVL